MKDFYIDTGRMLICAFAFTWNMKCRMRMRVVLNVEAFFLQAPQVFPCHALTGLIGDVLRINEKRGRITVLPQHRSGNAHDILEVVVDRDDDGRAFGGQLLLHHLMQPCKGDDLYLLFFEDVEILPEFMPADGVGPFAVDVVKEQNGDARVFASYLRYAGLWLADEKVESDREKECRYAIQESCGHRFFRPQAACY